MAYSETYRRLIDGTVYVVANDGLDKATTKQISTYTNTNEAYIYRCFSNKEDLLSKAFSALDEELIKVTMENISVMSMSEIDQSTRLRLYFRAIWRFILGNKNKCKTYVRYYYSAYFQRCSLAEHTKRFTPLVERFKAAFKDEANVWMLLNHALTTMLDFSIKIFNGMVDDNEDTEEHVFRLIYYSLSPYFRNSEVRVMYAENFKNY